MLTHFGEINFYVDGELGPEDVAEFVTGLERNARANAICNAFQLQKESLSRAMDLLEAARPSDVATSQMIVRLANALMRRAAHAPGPGPGTRTPPESRIGG